MRDGKVSNPKRAGAAWLVLAVGLLLLGGVNLLLNPDFTQKAFADPATCSGYPPTCNFAGGDVLVCCPQGDGTTAYSCVNSNTGLPSCDCTVIDTGNPTGSGS
jgi:hypothetical protein